MSNYKKTVWKDSLETEITAERLNNMENGIEQANEIMYRPNLFINGNFQIWSNGEEFSVKINDDGTYGGYVVTADRWTVGAWSSNTAYVYRTDKGLTFSRERDASIDVFQVLEEETLKSILGKTLTMSYQTLKNSTGEYEEHVRSIVLDENIEIEPFAIAEEYFSIELEMGYTLCWAKLEVGESATPCIPDSKEPILLNNTVGFIDVSRKIYEVKDENATSDTIIHLWTATEDCWCYLGGNAAGDGQYVARAYLDNVNIAAFWNVWPTSILFPVKKGQTLTKGNGCISATFYGMI